MLFICTHCLRVQRLFPFSHSDPPIQHLCFYMVSGIEEILSTNTSYLWIPSFLILLKISILVNLFSSCNFIKLYYVSMYMHLSQVHTLKVFLVNHSYNFGGNISLSTYLFFEHVYCSFSTLYLLPTYFW